MDVVFGLRDPIFWLLTSVSLAIVIYYWGKYTFWSSRNVRTPLIIPPFGNLYSQFWWPRAEIELIWMRKYGKVYGQYQGTTPCLVIGDADIIRRVAIKDFNVFPNRRLFPTLNKFQQYALIVQKDDHWRGMRSIISPTFASGKIKLMFGGFNECIDDICETIKRQLSKETGESGSIDTKVLMTQLSMSASLRSFYGIKLNGSDKSDTHDDDKVDSIEHFAKMATSAVRFSFSRLLMSSLLPNKLQRALGFSTVSTETGMEFLYQIAKQIVEKRRNNPNKDKYSDYLQILLDAEGSTSSNSTTIDENVVSKDPKFEDHHVIGREGADFEHSKTKLTEQEIYIQTMAFMIVATQTTSDLLANTLYLMAHHPEIQEKLRGELLKLQAQETDNSNGGQSMIEFNYDKLASCQYLDCVLSESMRFLPPVIEMDRVGNEDYFIGEPYNIQLPKGTCIKLAYHCVHLDPDYWPEPEIFDPDRFNSLNKPKIVPGSYNPFGLGPRFCVGFRFAMSEAKLAMAKLLTQFQILKPANSIYPPKPIKMALILSSYENLNVIFKKI